MAEEPGSQRRGRRRRQQAVWSSDWRGTPPREREEGGPQSRVEETAEGGWASRSRSGPRSLGTAMQRLSLDCEPLERVSPEEEDWEVSGKGMAAPPCKGCEGIGPHGGPRCRDVGTTARGSGDQSQSSRGSQSQSSGTDRGAAGGSERRSEAVALCVVVAAHEVAGVALVDLSCDRCRRTRQGENTGSQGARHHGGPGCAQSGRAKSGAPLQGGTGKVAAAATAAAAADAERLRATAQRASERVAQERARTPPTSEGRNWELQGRQLPTAGTPKAHAETGSLSPPQRQSLGQMEVDEAGAGFSLQEEEEPGPRRQRRSEGAPPAQVEGERARGRPAVTENPRNSSSRILTSSITPRPPQSLPRPYLLVTINFFSKN